ncbi:H-or Na-translocating F-type [Phytophthora nicotianae]|uniref:H-or Na-translocating F-type n=1 Tax=Phytophthora nicotianae TaxID=4792 RepID=A0A0W8DQZ3_PHYNI|nr:H-or Na-translocating F-type [Phytophthora nicotianae]
MSLTRSTSPRIRRPANFSSFPEVSHRRETISPLNNQQVETETDTNATVVSNPITQWKRGELIGEGTFGKVYKGLNIATGELFALKEIEIHSRPNDDQVTQMQKLGEEISLMNNLNHKHIVRYVLMYFVSSYQGSHRSENHFYIFMEYVPGGSIASMLKQFDAFSEDLIRIFTRQIVQGVAYLHEMGIIHRDIKGLSDKTKLGLGCIFNMLCAWLVQQPGANVLVNEQGVSNLEESLRSIRGSIPWMAPEVVKQIGHGYKADIWSIGATVIEMATAKHPWPHCHNGLAAMYTIAMATAPPPLPEHLSLEAKSFLQRCFCINPEGK